MQKLSNKHLDISPDDRVYCLSDIHGHADVLLSDYELIQQDLRHRPLKKGQVAHIIHLGDMCDKGPDTNKTYKFIYHKLSSSTASQNVRVHLVAGNHEQRLYDFVEGSDQEDAAWQREATEWIIYGGGLETLKSYGVIDAKSWQLFNSAKDELTRSKDELLTEKNLRLLRKIRAALRRKMNQSKHLGLLNGQYASAQCGHIFFCHAGIDPASRIPLRQQSLDIKTSARIAKARMESYQGCHLVHGHKSGKDAPRIGAFSIGIDPKTMRTGKGLVACFEGEEARFINTDDKIWTAPFIIKAGEPIVFPQDTASHPSRIERGRLIRPDNFDLAS